MDSRLTLAEARRIALTAQGFHLSRPARPALAHLRRALACLGLVQLDFVNVLVPAHYLVLFSRLGPYPRDRFDHLVYHRREYIEQWAHEASIVPVSAWPLLEHRRATHRVRPWGFENFLERHPEYVAWVLEQVRHQGPLTAEALPHPERESRRMGDAWFSTVPRAVLEAHFGRGALAIAHREPNMARAYDLAGRVIPPAQFACRLDAQTAKLDLLRSAARSLGIATVHDLADYYRMSLTDAKTGLASLTAGGELESVRVEGWRDTAYLHPEAAARKINAAALLSPFDPLIWFRPRTERLFAFEYRLEIYTPAPQRRWGYYVLPFLLGEQLVARVDLKADRARRQLAVLSLHLEPGQTRRRIHGPLRCELETLAAWLGLEGGVHE